MSNIFEQQALNAAAFLTLAGTLMPWKVVSYDVGTTHVVETVSPIDMVLKESWVIGTNNKIDESLETHSIVIITMLSVSLFVTVVTSLLYSLLSRDVLLARGLNEGSAGKIIMPMALASFLLLLATSILGFVLQAGFDKHWKFIASEMGPSAHYDHAMLFMGPFVLLIAMLFSGSVAIYHFECKWPF